MIVTIIIDDHIQVPVPVLISITTVIGYGLKDCWSHIAGNNAQAGVLCDSRQLNHFGGCIGLDEMDLICAADFCQT